MKNIRRAVKMNTMLQVLITNMISSKYLCCNPILPLILSTQEIDEYINQASTRGYEALKRVGRNGMTLAANAVMTSAIKVNKLIHTYTHTYMYIRALYTCTIAFYIAQNPM